MWLSYTNRPLLPLKLTQKQKSLSCTNLVQTIKGFTKRNSADNNRFLSYVTMEKSAVHPKETYASEANVSKDCGTVTSETQDFESRRDANIIEASMTKNFAWFHEIDAKEASKKLLNMQQDGVFLIRPASNPIEYVHYTLCVTYDGCVYNMYIRKKKDGYIALGKRKDNEKTFSSVSEMIRYHQNVPISIHAAEFEKSGKVYLLITPPK